MLRIAVQEEQRYAFLCVVDFESSINKSDGTHEMTEFPLVLLSTATPSLDIVDEFHAFVQPQRNAPLINYKGIPQQVFDESHTFPEAWQNLLTFLNRHGVTETNTLAITCGDWDFRAMLPAEQSVHNIDSIPLFENWCNIKHAFRSFTGKKKIDSMVRMLNIIGQELIGKHHSGIDDARNIARIALCLYKQGYIFKITSDGSMEERDLQRLQFFQSQNGETMKAAEEAHFARLSAGQISPREMFRKNERFSAWDDDGVPICLADGTLMSERAINKRRKKWKAQQVLHEKYLKWKKSIDSGEQSAHLELL